MNIIVVMWRLHCFISGPREQLNQASSYLDGSSVYGNTRKLQNDLRSWTGGRMKVFVTEHGEQLLPPNKDPLDGCNEESEMKKGRYCFLSGELPMLIFSFYFNIYRCTSARRYIYKIL